MKPTHDRASPDSAARDATAPPRIRGPHVCNSRTGGYMPLTGATVSDLMIRRLHDDARQEGNAELSHRCSIALRYPIRAEHAADRRDARKACVEAIYRRALLWLANHAPRHLVYAQFIGAYPVDLAVLRIPRYRLCWACNMRLSETAVFRIVEVRSGQATVHDGCVLDLIESGELQREHVANLPNEDDEDEDDEDDDGEGDDGEDDDDYDCDDSRNGIPDQECADAEERWARSLLDDCSDERDGLDEDEDPGEDQKHRDTDH